MRIFGLFEGERVPLELPQGVPVSEIKELIWKLLNIPGESGKQDKKVMVLTFAGSDLQDPWIFSDLGIRPGVTVKVSLQEEVKAVLFAQCGYNRTTISMFRNAQVAHMSVAALRRFVSKESGIPVGVFRLVTSAGKEMFDAFQLEDYGVDVGHTVFMVTWDGWNDFLNLAVMGYTEHVMSQLFSEETVARYQMKVAMYIAAHYGHVDLVAKLLRRDIRPDEPIGDHPTRQWCSENSHIDSLKTAVHEAAEMKQLRVLRTFADRDRKGNEAYLMARDGTGATPMNIALRNKAENIVQFLVTKQWTKISAGESKTIPLNIYCAVKRWCDRAKERVFLLKGTGKSSLGRRPGGALVSNGVMVDGFSRSQMNAGRKPPTRGDIRKYRELWKLEGEDPEEYFRTMQMFHTTLSALKTKRASKWGSMVDKTRMRITLEGISPERKSSETPSSGHSKLDIPDFGNGRPLPPIKSDRSGLSARDNSETGSTAETESSRSVLPKERRKAVPGTTRSRGKVSVTSVSAPNIRIECESTSPSKGPLGSNTTFRSVVGDREDKQSKYEGVQGYPNTKEARRKRKKARTITSAILLSKSRSTHGSLPLPVLNYNDTAHPKFYYNSQEGDIAKSTLAMYERRYRGMKPRDYAIHCLTIADSFKEKPWLERVRMAVNLNAKNVKRHWDLDGAHSYRSDVSTGLMTSNRHISGRRHHVTTIRVPKGSL